MPEFDRNDYPIRKRRIAGGAPVQILNDTAANWAEVDPVLGDGEPGHEKDTGVYKVGDGATPWSELDVVGGSGSGAPGLEIFNTTVDVMGAMLWHRNTTAQASPTAWIEEGEVDNTYVITQPGLYMVMDLTGQMMGEALEAGTSTGQLLLNLDDDTVRSVEFNDYIEDSYLVNSEVGVETNLHKSNLLPIAAGSVLSVVVGSETVGCTNWSVALTLAPLLQGP